MSFVVFSIKIDSLVKRAKIFVGSMANGAVFHDWTFHLFCGVFIKIDSFVKRAKIFLKRKKKVASF